MECVPHVGVLDSSGTRVTPRHRRVGTGQGVRVGVGVHDSLDMGGGMGGIGVGVGAGVGAGSNVHGSSCSCGVTASASQDSTNNGYGDVCVLRSAHVPAIHRSCPAPHSLHLSLGKVDHSHGPHMPLQTDIVDGDEAAYSTPSTTALRPTVRAQYLGSAVESMSWTVN